MFGPGPSGFFTRPTVIMLFLLCVFLYYLFPFENTTPEEVIKKAKTKEKKQSLQKEENKESNVNDEYLYGTKRYKLYERIKLNYKKADAYCKKHHGLLAKTETLDEMVRLKTLLSRAKSVSDEVWIRVEKKEWKRHAWKDKPHPPGMNPEALSGMGAMMMGGGKQEMCPALSSSTRSLFPAMCLRDLPFVCEFEREDKPKKEEAKPKKPEKKVQQKQGIKNNKNNKKGKIVTPPPQQRKVPTATKKPLKTTVKPTLKKSNNQKKKKSRNEL